MPASVVTTLARGSDPAALAHQTVDQLWAAAGSQPVRAGLLYLSGLPQARLSSALSSMLPGVELMGATTLEPGPALAGFWLVGEVRAVVAVRLRPDQDGRALAEAAVARSGFRSFQARLAILHAAEGGLRPGELFEVLPQGAAFLGADVAEVWTEVGPAQEALLLADWQPRLAVGFEGATQALEYQGLSPESCVGMLRLRTGEAEETPAALAQVPHTSALVRSIYGTPDRSPQAPATGTLLLSNIKERAEG